MGHALPDVNAEDVPKEITRADQFCVYLEKMTGPEDSDERKRSMNNAMGDGGNESRQSKRQKPNTSEEEVHQGHSASKPTYECMNGCGRNATHDTSGCIICGVCSKRGHYAKKCPNKSKVANNGSNGHNIQSSNRMGHGRNGFGNRGRGSYRGGPQWQGP
ncbi:hypothetical protein BGZ51_009777, partial [Haplosporangium sp. Z 767]